MEKETKSRTHWTEEEITFLKKNWTLPMAELSEKLGRSIDSCLQKAYSLGMYRRKWTQAEIDYLQENYGKYSIPSLAKSLGKSVNAIKVMRQRLGLGAFLMNGEYISLCQLIRAVNGTVSAYSYKMTSWVKNRGLPVHTKKVESCSFRVVYLDEFWEWAEKNRSFLDFSKMEPLSLGAEPAWVAEQRKKDAQAFANQRKDPWTPQEDSQLKMLLKQHKYGYKELSEMLHRSAGAIQRRVLDLGIKERPVKADTHGKEAQWTDETYAILAEGIRRGDSYYAIGLKLGKSEKAIRGKVYYDYLTENADKIRQMLGDGPWGTGKPVPTVKQAATLSKVRTAMKNDMEQLCGVLLYRLQQLKGYDYDRYFQRAMCMKWDDLHGVCTAGCDDCDYCIEFQRIQPQYCVRCGVTFFERAENRMCLRCRSARKQQAARKYYRLYGKGKKEEIE